MEEERKVTAWDDIDRILTTKIPAYEGKLPTLSDFDDSYQGVIEETKKLFHTSPKRGKK